MKKYLSLILALGICMSMCVFPAAAISANEAENEVLTEDEFTELLTAEMSSNEFGGLYYEGDTLVVNVIASQKATSLRRHPKILTWNTAQSRTPFLSWSA